MLTKIELKLVTKNFESHFSLPKIFVTSLVPFHWSVTILALLSMVVKITF